MKKEEFDKLRNESRGYTKCFVAKEELRVLQDRMGRAETKHDVEELSRSAERRANTSAEAMKHLLMTKIDAGAAI